MTARRTICQTQGLPLQPSRILSKPQYQSVLRGGRSRIPHCVWDRAASAAWPSNPGIGISRLPAGRRLVMRRRCARRRTLAPFTTAPYQAQMRGMKQGIIFIVALLLPGCSMWDKVKNQMPEPTDLSFPDAVLAKDAALKLEPSGSSVAFVCGPSIAKSYFIKAEGKAAWEDDPTPTGRTVPVKLPSGEFDLVFRGAYQSYISAIRDGGLVVKAWNPPDTNEFGLTVIYPKTGIVETYSFLNDGPETAKVIWTSNKPHVLMTYSKAGASVAKCRRLSGPQASNG